MEDSLFIDPQALFDEWRDDPGPGAAGYRSDERILLEGEYGLEIYMRDLAGEWRRVLDDRKSIPFEPDAPGRYLATALRRSRDLAGISQRALASRAGVGSSAGRHDGGD
jgi:hypothetical protein